MAASSGDGANYYQDSEYMADLSLFIAKSDVAVIEALKRIDANKKGFLIVEDTDGIVVGTLTDGDIRRAFIVGVSVDDSIDKIYTRQFKSLRQEDGMSKAIGDYFGEDDIIRYEDVYGRA